MNRIRSYIYSFIFLALTCPSNLYAQAVSGTLNGHDYVDLGLSVKWATCNVGATKPSDYGNYYAWGETKTKTEYTFDNSKTYGKEMGDISGKKRYDAARAIWGGSWRMPTAAEIQELIDNCTWTWTVQDGHNGYRITGPNGNSIFLPATGSNDEKPSIGAGLCGGYWTSSPPISKIFRGIEETGDARFLYFDDTRCDLTIAHLRIIGHSVRPVTK